MSQWAVPGFAEERQLGRGASGRVVAAVHAASGQRVAIKYLSPKLLRDQEFVTRFRAEADLLRSVDVPQVVRMLGYAEDPGRGAAIIMELVHGVSLHAMISRNGPTSAEAALVVLKGSLLGLAAAHALGIVHRDYKPENVLVDAEGTSKLSDFGVAVRAGRRAPAAGTPLYMAPEQWLGAPATPASDIYAATAVFFECLTGQTPFPGPLAKLEQQHAYAAVPVEQVDEPLRGLVLRGMAKNPAYRPADAIGFLTDLEATATTAYGPTWEARGRDQLRRAAAALLLLLGPGAVGGGTGVALAATWFGRHKGMAIGAAATSLALVAGVAATAVALTGGGGPGPARSSPAANSSQHGGPSATAVASASASPTPSRTPSAGATASGPGRSTTAPPAGANGGGGNGGGGGTTTTPPAPTISLTVDTDPSSPVSVTCGTTPSTVNFIGNITTDQAATVTYQWTRSDGTSSGPKTTTVDPTATTQVIDPVTPSSDNGTLTDTLQLSSPVSVTRQATVDISCSYPSLSVSTGSLPNGTQYSSYSAQVSATGGDGNYQWSASGLPPGLSIDGAGAITGDPQATGTFSVTVTVTDGESAPQSAMATLSLTVSPPIIY